MSTDGDGGGGGAEGEAFVELLLQEVRDGGMDCPSVQLLTEMARSGDSDTVADALIYLVEAGVPDKAASCLRYIMAHAPQQQLGGAQGSESQANDGEGAPLPGGAAAKLTGKPPVLNYTVAGKILNRIVELGNLSEAQDLTKFLLVARETDRGRGKMLDCYDVSLLLGAMVPTGAAESAGRLLFGLYCSEAGSEDAAASQTLVPFILGTLLDHERAGQAVELGKQLMYTTLEEIEAGGGEYDYTVLGWCLAQMVWYGRADWAARLCVELEQQQLEWYSGGDMLAAVASWGDNSYSATIVNFMQDVRGPGRDAAGAAARGR